jgi:hypothetical protein
VYAPTANMRGAITTVPPAPTISSATSLPVAMRSARSSASGMRVSTMARSNGDQPRRGGTRATSTPSSIQTRARWVVQRCTMRAIAASERSAKKASVASMTARIAISPPPSFDANSRSRAR